MIGTREGGAQIGSLGSSRLFLLFLSLSLCGLVGLVFTTFAVAGQPVESDSSLMMKTMALPAFPQNTAPRSIATPPYNTAVPSAHFFLGHLTHPGVQLSLIGDYHVAIHMT